MMATSFLHDLKPPFPHGISTFFLPPPQLHLRKDWPATMEAWGAGAAVLETLKTSETSPKSSGAGCQLQSPGANGGG